VGDDVDLGWGDVDEFVEQPCPGQTDVAGDCRSELS
jgi:hypothetical protein